MKKIFRLSSIIVVLMMIATASCKKQNSTEPQNVSLENTTWLFTKEILHFPNGKLEIFTRNSVWYFLGDHKLKVFNPDSFIQEERGEWSVTTDKIVVTIKDDNLGYQRNYKIISKTDSYMRLNVEDVIIETSDNGKTSQVHYDLVKI